MGEEKPNEITAIVAKMRELLLRSRHLWPDMMKADPSVPYTTLKGFATGEANYSNPRLSSLERLFPLCRIAEPDFLAGCVIYGKESDQKKEGACAS